MYNNLNLYRDIFLTNNKNKMPTDNKIHPKFLLEPKLLKKIFLSSWMREQRKKVVEFRE